MEQIYGFRPTISSEEGIDIYKNILAIPRIRATQREVLEWAGFDRINAGEKERALSALHHLSNARFCFYYERLAYDKAGIPVTATYTGSSHEQERRIFQES